MASFRIRGGKPLQGRIPIQGSKNSALPIIAACLLTDQTCVIDRVPDISDVHTMLAIAKSLGADVAWDSRAHRVVMTAAALSNTAPAALLARKLRGSILFAGALLGRAKTVSIPYPGGDVIGARPLDTHIHAFGELGATVRKTEHITIDGTAMRGADVTLEESSVTATENIILASVLTPGKTIIRLAACEPHVQELMRFLQTMGADIRWRELLLIEINGVAKLSGATHRLNADELEISGFAALAAATHSALDLGGIEPKYLDAVLLQLKKMGVNARVSSSTLEIREPDHPYHSFRIQSGLYPKLISDHLPPFAVLATQAEGSSLIHDWMYENRLRYIPELQKMGANCTILDPHRATITGPSPLTGCRIETFDIRSGMTLIVAALAAAGESTIAAIEHIDRGYERIDERIRAIGGDIQRIAD